MSLKVDDVSYGDPINVDFNVTSINSTYIPTGSANITIYNQNNQLVYTTTTNNLSSLIINDNLFDAGNYRVNVKFTPNNNKAIGSDANYNFTINKVTPTFTTINAVTVTYGNYNITVSGNVVGVPNGVNYTGTVTIKIRDKTYSASVNADGTFTKDLTWDTNLSLGTYTVDVTGSGDTNYNAPEDTSFQLTINKATSNIISKITENIKIDQNATVNINLPNTATGNITITFNNKQYSYKLENGATVATLPKVPAGKYAVTISYNGDKNYYPANNVTEKFTVYEYNATDLQTLINQAINNNTSELNLTHDYIFSENETVPVKINGTIKINGNNHIINANTTKGIFNIIDNDVELKNMTLTGTNGTVIISTGNNTKIQNIILNNNTGAGINITGDNTKLNNINITDSNGTGINIKGNNNNITNINITDSTGLTININGNTSNIANITLNNMSGTGVNVNGTGGIVENVTSSGGCGTVVNVVGGNSTVNNVSVSNHTVDGSVVNVVGDNSTVTDVGLDNVSGTGVNVNGTGATISNVSAQGGNGTVVDAKGDNTTVSEVEIINHKGTGVSTNGSGVNVSDVTATGGSGTVVDAKGTNATIRNITADKHDGTPIVAPSDANVTPAKVIKIDTSITANSQSYIINYGGIYSVVLNSQVAGKTVTLTINGQRITAGSDANGVAVFSLNKAVLGSVGVKPVSVSFDGDSNYNPSTTGAVITVNKEVTKITAKSVKKTYKKSKTKKLVITLKNSRGKSMGNVKVTLKVNKKLKGKLGKKLKKGYAFTVKFNSRGVGYISLKNNQVNGFKKGSYKFTVSYKGSAFYKVASKKNIVMKVK